MKTAVAWIFADTPEDADRQKELINQCAEAKGYRVIQQYIAPRPPRVRPNPLSGTPSIWMPEGFFKSLAERVDGDGEDAVTKWVDAVICAVEETSDSQRNAGRVIQPLLKGVGIEHILAGAIVDSP